MKLFLCFFVIFFPAALAADINVSLDNSENPVFANLGDEVQIGDMLNRISKELHYYRVDSEGDIDVFVSFKADIYQYAETFTNVLGQEQLGVKQYCAGRVALRFQQNGKTIAVATHSTISSDDMMSLHERAQLLRHLSHRAVQNFIALKKKPRNDFEDWLEKTRVESNSKKAKKMFLLTLFSELVGEEAPKEDLEISLELSYNFETIQVEATIGNNKFRNSTDLKYKTYNVSVEDAAGKVAKQVATFLKK